jgi:Rod binding domain-containing protein
MAGNLSDIRKGLAGQLAQVRGLRVSEQVPEQINPPAVNANGGLTEWEMQVQLVAGRMADQQSQRQIDEWLSWDGPQSVRAAIESDRTLGGGCQTSRVASADALSTIQIGDSEYIGVTLNVTVWA